MLILIPCFWAVGIWKNVHSMEDPTQGGLPPESHTPGSLNSISTYAPGPGYNTGNN